MDTPHTVRSASSNARINDNSFTLHYNGSWWGDFRLAQPGRFNILNATAAIALANRFEIPRETIQSAFDSFTGVRRRMETLLDTGGLIIIDDFAHHPTAIRSTLGAIREKYADRKLIALFEPRSNTTTRNIFQRELALSFDPADVVIIGKLNRPERYAPEERLSIETLTADLEKRGIEAHAIPDAGEMVDTLITRIDSESVVVFLSNGDFGGAREKLVNRYASRGG